MLLKILDIEYIIESFFFLRLTWALDNGKGNLNTKEN